MRRFLVTTPVAALTALALLSACGGGGGGGGNNPVTLRPLPGGDGGAGGTPPTFVTDLEDHDLLSQSVSGLTDFSVPSKPLTVSATFTGTAGFERFEPQDGVDILADMVLNVDFNGLNAGTGSWITGSMENFRTPDANFIGRLAVDGGTTEMQDNEVSVELSGDLAAPAGAPTPLHLMLLGGFAGGGTADGAPRALAGDILSIGQFGDPAGQDVRIIMPDGQTYIGSYVVAR